MEEVIQEEPSFVNNKKQPTPEQEAMAYRLEQLQKWQLNRQEYHKPGTEKKLHDGTKYMVRQDGSWKKTEEGKQGKKRRKAV